MSSAETQPTTDSATIENPQTEEQQKPEEKTLEETTPMETNIPTETDNTSAAANVEAAPVATSPTNVEQTTNELAAKEDNNVSMTAEEQNNEAQKTGEDKQRDTTPTPNKTQETSGMAIETIVASNKKQDDKVTNHVSAAKNMPTRQYLDETIVPILLQALSALAKERPADPIDFVGNYLLREKNRFSNSFPSGEH